MHIELEKCADRWVGCANRFSGEEMTESDNAPSFSDLPEGYVTDILSITSPRDACRASSISKAFHSAADSDAYRGRFYAEH
ncbi:putative F-box-like domain superfamily protein [Helianthus annuus]|nr:putative F-box-like domain superfamily protein [Helianthus annuus]